MKVAVFGNLVGPDFVPVLRKFFHFFEKNQIEIQIYEPFFSYLSQELKYTPVISGFFNSFKDFDSTNKLIFSIGGDGTFLQSVQTIRNFNVPVVGVNSGRMGFLADISKELVIDALTDILEGRCRIVERSMLEVEIENYDISGFNYALNEMTVLKTTNSSMINIRVTVNGEFLNTYWADGLIISTPTGSTAYSLSVGGPILTPGSENFVITPIASHNLTIRPIVVPDNIEIKLEVSGRGTNFLASFDSRSVSVGFQNSINVKKAGFKLKTILPEGHTFFNTLRTKLLWGFDKRN